MNSKQIEGLLHQAIQNLFEHQESLGDFTSETGETEWNLGHHLANEISALFPEYDCDIDIIKHPSNKRPDIILHKRGNHDRNFLVIEIKRDRKGLQKDKEKICKYWFQPRLSYQFGGVVCIDESGAGKHRVEVDPNPAPPPSRSGPSAR